MGNAIDSFVECLSCFDRILPEQPREGEVGKLAINVQRVIVLDAIFVIVTFIVGIITIAVSGGWWGTTYILWCLLLACGFYGAWKRHKVCTLVFLILMGISFGLSLLWIILIIVDFTRLNIVCAQYNLVCNTGWYIVDLILIIFVAIIEGVLTYFSFHLYQKLEDAPPAVAAPPPSNPEATSY